MNASEHAERMREIADAVIETTPDPLRGGDRVDLANLLSVIGATWVGAISAGAPTAEQLRWTRVCVTAQRIAERLEQEIGEESERVPQRRGLRLLAGMRHDS